MPMPVPRPVTRQWLLAAMLITIPCSPAVSQRLTGPAPSAPIPAPVTLDTTGLFLSPFAKVGDDVFIGGQPTERALRKLRTQGVTTIVNLRTPSEMTANVPFDEAALARELGMTYVNLPMRGNAEYPYSPRAVTAFATAMSAAGGKVLLHCTVAWRASHLWAAYLIQERGVAAATALDHARLMHLMESMGRAGEMQPVEEFLGRAVPELKRPLGRQ